MTRGASILYLSRSDVESLAVSMADIIDAVERMLHDKGRGRAEMPPKPGIHPGVDAFIHAMPGFLPDLGAAGVKWVSGFPQNRERGLPYVSGLIILNDPATGLPTSVMDATWITAMRTGAATAVAARHLARHDSSTVGIIACGVQGRSNLEALTRMFRVSAVYAYDLDTAAAHRFAEEAHQRWGVNVSVVSTPERVVRQADIVVTSGPIHKDPHPTIKADWLAPGAFACTLDFDSYWHGTALAEADKVATDDLAQLEYYRAAGYFRTTPTPYADLGEIVAGTRPGRESADERIICINLGLALEDIATADLVHQRARRLGVGVELPL
jgi:ornithine cyclodeaminase/alanine dehydrogenase